MDINSMGFRDEEIPERKKDEDIRILVLGDSITWGDYIQADEVYVERIEHYLSETLKNRAVEVINAGVEDIGLKEEIDIFEEKGLAVEPDVVVIAFYLNDSRPPWGFLGELGRYGFLRRHSVLAQTIYRKLVLKKWISKKGTERFGWLGMAEKLPWQNDRQAFLQLAALAEYDWGSSWKGESWEIIERELARLKAHQEKEGFKVAVVAFPVSYQVYAEFIEATPQLNMQRIARNMDFPYLDLLPLLREHNDMDLFYDQCHPKPRANDIIGKHVAEFLIEEVLDIKDN
jgi:lysophospholipase L1-like esterase